MEDDEVGLSQGNSTFIVLRRCYFTFFSLAGISSQRAWIHELQRFEDDDLTIEIQESRQLTEHWTGRDLVKGW